MAVTAVSGSTPPLPNTPATPARAPVCDTVVLRVETPEVEVKQTITTCVQLKAPTEETAADSRKITAAAEKHRQSQVAQKIGQRNVDQNSYPPVPAGKTTPYGFHSADVGTAQDLLNRYYQPTATKASAPRYEPLTTVAVNRSQREAEAWQTAANVTRVVRDGSVVLAGALAAPVLGVPGALASFGTGAVAGTTLSVGSSALSAASAPDEERQRFLTELQDPTKHLTLGFLSGLGALTIPTQMTPVGRPLPPGGDVFRPQLPGGTPPQLPSSNVNHFSGVTIEVPRVVVE